MKHSPAQTAAGSSSVDLVALAEYVEQFSGKTVAVLGDFVADEFQFGEISRVSREAPVLILRHRETRLVPGGGANAANNLAALGARVLPITAVGQDNAGDALIAYFKEKRMDVSGILRVKGHTTPTKTRFLAGWAHTVGQQVLRVDREPQAPLPPASHKRIGQLLQTKLRSADALAVSDYGFGVATPELVRQVTSKRKAVVVTLDARYALASYAKSGVTSATPNEAELEALHHTAIGQNLEELARCGRAKIERWQQGCAGDARLCIGFADARNGRRQIVIAVLSVGDQLIELRRAEAVPPIRFRPDGGGILRLPPFGRRGDVRPSVGGSDTTGHQGSKKRPGSETAGEVQFHDNYIITDPAFRARGVQAKFCGRVIISLTA